MNIDRYLINFDTEKIEKEYHDVVIIGSGIAGVFTALSAPEKYDIAIITKESIDISNSVLAQGGIAVSLDKGDSPELHFKDTLYAGAGLCNEENVWVLVNEAAHNIKSLVKYGVNFDREDSHKLSFSREAAHSKNRIIHAGDTTGKEVCDKLISIVKTRKNVKIDERIFAIDLLTEGNSCRGVLAYNEDTATYKLYMARVVVCATGGFGQIYSHTTNPEVATGDGICLAYRAGAELMDLEFIQFHPTVLHHPQNKSFLISEAVRGEGAQLKNIHGKRFMEEYHELKELAPRDVVSRAIFREMKKTGSDHVYLDITFKGKEYLMNRFPNIYKTCMEYGIDISVDMIPVSPAEHYCMGGIKTDAFGRTSITGLYACGEAACNGIHGANRLASNSLLEGLVFGQKIGSEIAALLDQNSREQELNIKYEEKRLNPGVDAECLKADIQRIMTAEAGIVRDAEGLKKALDKLNQIYSCISGTGNESIKDFELQNVCLLSRLVIESALERTESRGAHYRSDYPMTDDLEWRRHIVKRPDSCI